MKRTVLVFLIDALGWKTLGDRPFLAEIVRTRCPLRTVLGFSSAAEPSILTGKLPVEHGRWTMYPRAQRGSPFGIARWLALYPSSLPGAHRVRRAVAWWVRARGHVRGYFDLYEVPLALLPQFDLCERNALFDVGGVPESPTLFDRLADDGIPFRSWWWSTPEADNWRDLERAVAAGESAFYFLYSPALDAAQHTHGVDSPEVAAHLSEYERRIAAIYRTAQARGLDPALFVFADHGMRDTEGTVDVMARMRATGALMPREYLAFYDSTMARFWFRSDGARERILAAAAAVPHARLMDDDELRREGVLFPDRRYGEAIVLMDPGWQIEPSFMGSRAPRAMHGFHPDDPWSDAAFLSDRSFAKGPADLRDLLPLLLAAAKPGLAS